MKIDSQSPNFDPAVKTARTEGTTAADSTGVGRTAAGTQADAVSLSPDAQLAAKAIAAATGTSDVRPEVVERAKALLASGELGNDPVRLADAIIDRTIESSQD